jgi:hypothetical protein
MPLDDLSLDLTPPAPAEPGPAEPGLPRPTPLEVMTRALRLPTLSKRQARSIVRIQLDRLSPLPVAETVFDVVLIHPEGTEGLWALGIARKVALLDPALTTTAVIPVAKSVEGTEVVFRFRNPGAVSAFEARWLANAPAAAIIAVGLAAVALAANVRADQWCERRLPEVAEAARSQAQLAHDAQQQRDARAEWTALHRADASTRLLCVLSRLGAKAPGGVAIAGLSATQRAVTIQIPAGGDVAALTSAGATAPANPDAAGGTPATFEGGNCG